MIKKLKVSDKTYKLAKRTSMAACALSTASAVILTGCGFNKQLVDFNKSFNVAVENNGDAISVVPISGYADYTGSQIQFKTSDGLVVLSSTQELGLINVKSQEALDDYIDVIKDDNDTVNYYDTNIQYGDYHNKTLIDLQYSFNKALIVEDDHVAIVDITKWTDYDEDDKIQIKLANNNTCLLKEIENVKLVNDKNADENAAYNYAVTLVGSPEKVKQLKK